MSSHPNAMEIRMLTPEEYIQFCEGMDINAVHTIGIYRRLKLRNDDVRIYGGYVNSELKIAMIADSIPAWKVFRWLYAPMGFVMEDYDDMDTIKAFMEALTPMMKKEKTLFFRMESVIELVQHDGSGAVVEGGFDNNAWRDAMKSIGFVPEELWSGYDFSRQCRWAAQIDLAIPKFEYKGYPATKEQLAHFDENFTMLTPDEVLKNMELKTRQSVKLSQRPYIKVRPLAYEELDLLREMVDSAADHHGFHSNTQAKDQNLYQGYGDLCEVLYAWLDVPEYSAYMHKQYDQAKAHLEERKAKYEESPGRRNKKALHTAEQDLEVLEKKMKELHEIEERYPKEVPLSAAMFIKSPTETLYLTSGSNREFMRFAGAYAIQWKMIQDGLARKALRHNFWGISGIFDPEHPSFGVYAFKRGFNSRVIEYAGDFTWIFMPKMTAMYEAYIKKKNQSQTQ